MQTITAGYVCQYHIKKCLCHYVGRFFGRDSDRIPSRRSGAAIGVAGKLKRCALLGAADYTKKRNQTKVKSDAVRCRLARLDTLSTADR